MGIGDRFQTSDGRDSFIRGREQSQGLRRTEETSYTKETKR
jgi:hypothetical protein